MLALLAAASLPIAEPAESPVSWITPESYPVDALAAGQEGKVRVTLSINENGNPENCAVDVSSGVPALDEGTCGILMSRAKFLPPKDSSGKPSAAIWSRNVNWVIPRGVPNSELARYSVGFDQYATPVTCTVTENGHALPLQPSLCEALVTEMRKNGVPLDKPAIVDLPKKGVVRSP